MERYSGPRSPERLSFARRNYRLSAVKRPRSCNSILLFCVVLSLALPLSCSSTTEPPSGDPRVDLRSGDPRIRIHGARVAAEASRLDLLEDLSLTLSDPDPAVRMFAEIALRKITHKDFDFKPHGTTAEREEARARWVEWIAAQKKLHESGVNDPSTARKEELQDGSTQRS